jgi:exopolysaccharide/PEP-CTERM locus tyrosine autokinase
VSLVEQAIARLRQTKAPARPAPAVLSPPRPAAEKVPPARPRESVAPSVAPLRPPASLPAPKQLMVDLDVLRRRGYLPEPSADRQLAINYRQIKRPIVEAATADPEIGASDPRVIMVTSALPGDGKTFTSINLGLSLARERDISVLLVDADVPKPHVSEIFGVRDEPGLMNALVDEAEVESLIFATNIRGFSVLPAGRMVEGAAEMLLSNRMRKLLSGLTAAYPRRLVLLDSAPLLITSEGRALLKIAGQTVLVVRSGKTPRHALRDAVALMGDQKGAGIVLNEGQKAFTEGYYGYGTYGLDR